MDIICPLLFLKIAQVNVVAQLSAAQLNII
jgi:hypothetical protein